MEQKLNNLKKQFDSYINEIKNTEVYLDYINAKKMLENCEEANNIINDMKELQKARNSCKKHRQDDLVIKIENDLERLDTEYDLLFEVVNFNIAYDKLVTLVNKIKNNIEQQIN